MAVGLLAGAFASVARKSHTPVSAHWLTGWVLIVFHFFAFMFLGLPGFYGTAAGLLGLWSLIWAGILFMRASVPYRSEASSRAMFVALLGSYTIYVAVLESNPSPRLLEMAAVLLGAAPLAVGLFSIRQLNQSLRLFTVGLQCALAVFLLAVQNRPDGGNTALNAVLFTVYLGATVHFWHMYRRASAGAFITISGFLLWANVFTVAPILMARYPQVHFESEVWNLPKYVVAVGMILVLLEDQIAHNKHLALHDALTGLPNRRLFQDRLASTLERARRTETSAALLMLDLDHFKQVNDTLGHHVGDILLQKVAELFSGRVRRSDTVARTGGDEFAVILEGPTSHAEARHVGHTLLELLVEPLLLEGRQVQAHASLGVAVFPEDADDMEQLCIRADLRMYDHKRGASDPDRAVPPQRVQSLATLESEGVEMTS